MKFKECLETGKQNWMWEIKKSIDLCGKARQDYAVRSVGDPKFSSCMALSGSHLL